MRIRSLETALLRDTALTKGMSHCHTHRANVTVTRARYPPIKSPSILTPSLGLETHSEVEAYLPGLGQTTIVPTKPMSNGM